MPKTKLKSPALKTEDLVDIHDASSCFGRGWSNRTIYRRIENGNLIEGLHYIDDAPPNSKKRLIKLIKPAIQELRGTARHER